MGECMDRRRKEWILRGMYWMREEWRSERHKEWLGIGRDRRVCE